MLANIDLQMYLQASRIANLLFYVTVLPQNHNLLCERHIIFIDNMTDVSIDAKKLMSMSGKAECNPCL